MSEIKRKRILVVLRQAPYGSGLARAAVDFSLAMGAFEQDFELLFLGEGVLQLVAGQAGEAIGQKSVGKVLSSLPLFDKESVFVDAVALQRLGLRAEDLVLPTKPLGATEITAMLDTFDHLVSC